MRELIFWRGGKINGAVMADRRQYFSYNISLKSEGYLILFDMETIVFRLLLKMSNDFASYDIDLVKLAKYVLTSQNSSNIVPLYKKVLICIKYSIETMIQ